MFQEDDILGGLGMNIKAIKVCKTLLQFNLDETLETQNIQVKEYLPFGDEERKGLDQKDIIIQGDSISIPRFNFGYDRIASRFKVLIDGKPVNGVQYVTQFDSIAQWDYAYPQPDTIKALAASGEDLRILGIKQSLININLPAFMTLQKNEDSFPYFCNGRTFYFVKKEVEKLDQYMKETYEYGIIVTGILLNSPKLFDSQKEEELLSKVVHPSYDRQDSSAYISAFNMETEEGQEYYKAFLEFLAERYAREDGRYGRMCGFIISNEVNSQYVWGNAGEMEVADYVKEYSVALRLAWLSARKYYSNFRIYVSLDHFWTSTLKPEFPKRFYKGRDVIDYLNQYSKEEGNFDWNIAYHPYPENLMYPDFYNDRSATFDFSTTRITFKNIEMLPAYLSQPEYLYEGKPRRIILSEQGFNSRGDRFSEKQGAAAYCLAYEKARKIDTIDLMTHHAYVDNRYEFGLNLGIRRLNDDDTVGEPKPIYYVMKDMDTEKEKEHMDRARAFIGEELYESILNPVILYADADKSKENEFYEGEE